jgi:hypothetical protein
MWPASRSNVGLTLVAPLVHVERAVDLDLDRVQPAAGLP